MPWKDHESPDVLKSKTVSLLITSDYLLTLPEEEKVKKDKTGQAVQETLLKQGFTITNYDVLPNNVSKIRQWVKAQAAQGIGLVIVSGGTGLGKKDVSVEAIQPLFHKEIIGFGELHRRKSFEEIGEKAILSRTTAGIIDKSVVIITPGSTKATLLGVEIILQVLPHLQKILNP